MRHARQPHSFPTRRSSDLRPPRDSGPVSPKARFPSALAPAIMTPGESGGDLSMIIRAWVLSVGAVLAVGTLPAGEPPRSEEHTSELQSLRHLVCRLLLEKK